jgi:hypothetical protein
MIKRTFVMAVFLLVILSRVQAQDDTHVELREVVDSPTAGLLSHGSYGMDLRLFSQGGLLMKISVGLLGRLTIGCSYGGLNIIGEGQMHGYPRAGLQARIRLRDETFVMPGMAVGFDSQGYGPYHKEQDRYQIKSKGIYVVLSKCFWAVGPLGIHIGSNYSFEDRHGDKDLSFFCGIDKDLIGGFVFLAEFDLALNDDGQDGTYGTGHGYLNAGWRWNLANTLSLECILKNLTDNVEMVHDVSREIRLIFWNHF